MAGIVKWLRPRIVVPIYVGSNPTTRPIKKTSTYVEVFCIVWRDYKPTQNVSFVRG